MAQEVSLRSSSRELNLLLVLDVRSGKADLTDRMVLTDLKEECEASTEARIRRRFVV